MIKITKLFDRKKPMTEKNHKTCSLKKTCRHSKFYDTKKFKRIKKISNYLPR